MRNISFYGTTQQKGHETVNETGLLCGCRGGAGGVDTITNKPCNGLFWSPMGNYLLIAGLGVGKRSPCEA